MNQGPSAADVRRWHANLQNEIEGVAIYRALADAEADERRSVIFRKLCEIEGQHVAHWSQLLQSAGVEPGTESAFGLRTQVLVWLAQHVGTGAALPLLTSFEQDSEGSYRDQPDAGHLANDERTHARVLATLVRSTSGADGILQAERWQSGRDSGGSFRAGVFGLNDGLASNLSLIMGMAGAEPGHHIIVLAGIAGLLAGAFSMAAGEYISMSQQRELFEQQLRLEHDELEAAPEEEEEELSLIYQAKGVQKDHADSLAAQLMRDPRQALDTLAREELGLNPDELGSPWGAAMSSFVLFGTGALIPLAPFLLGAEGLRGVITSAVASGLSLFAIGAALSLFTGRHPFYGGVRTLLITSAAATVTFLIGRFIGVSIS